MVPSTATTKIRIALTKDQLDQVRSIVKAGRAGSVSGFVQHAVGVALRDAAEWCEMLKEALEQTGGPLTKEEREWADSIIFESKRRKKRGKAA